MCLSSDDRERRFFDEFMFVHCVHGVVHFCTAWSKLHCAVY